MAEKLSEMGLSWEVEVSQRKQSISLKSNRYYSEYKMNQSHCVTKSSVLKVSCSCPLLVINILYSICQPLLTLTKYLKSSSQHHVHVSFSLKYSPSLDCFIPSSVAVQRHNNSKHKKLQWPFIKDLKIYHEFIHVVLKIKKECTRINCISCMT